MFMEAVSGTERTIIHQGKEHTVKIPAGASDGTRIRFQDFDVSIEVATHDKFKRDGYDVYVDVLMSFTVASLGGSINVPTLDEKDVTLRIRPGTQSHTMIRLQGKGIPYLRGSGKGDLYVRLIVKVPEKLSREQRKLLESLQESL